MGETLLHFAFHYKGYTLANTVEWIDRTYVQQTMFSVITLSISIVSRRTYGPSTKL